MDESTEKYFTDLIAKMEQKASQRMVESEERTASLIKSEISSVKTDIIASVLHQFATVRSEVKQIVQEMRKKTSSFMAYQRYRMKTGKIWIKQYKNLRRKCASLTQSTTTMHSV
jgi:5'-deoxynucleotidase YfbR-like HD superfamily hydrolase